MSDTTGGTQVKGNLIVSDVRPRCTGCHKLLAEKLTRPWSIRCYRCKRLNSTPEPGQAQAVVLEPVENP